MEILVALVPMIAWGSIAFVSNKLGGDANQQTLGMTMGAFFFSVIMFLIWQPTMDLRIALIGFLSGFCWSIGQNKQFHTMKHLGISVGLPISTGLQLVLNTIAGAVLFREWQTTRDFTLGILAVIVLILGVYLTSKRDPAASYTLKSHDIRQGLKAVLYSTLGFAAYTIIITWAGLDPKAIILPQSIGMLMGAALFALKKTKVDRYVWRNLLTGLMWGLGNVCLLASIQKIGLAVAFSLSQMGIIISTLGGIFLLHEHKTKKELRYVLAGCLLVIAGGVLLGYMKM